MFDPETFLTAKKEFEERLRDLISKEIEGFRKQTSCSPSAINCKLIEVTAFEDRDRQYMITGVETKFELFGDKVFIK